MACTAVGVWFAAMKVSAPVAERTELLLELITTRPSTIIVDPTDLIGLLGLALASMIMANPRPLLTNRQVGYLSLAVAGMACVASSGPEYFNTDLGVDPKTGEVVERVNDRYSPDFENADQADVVGFNEFATEACLGVADGGDCFRIVDGRVERQADNGGWELEWVAFDHPVVALNAHGGWGPPIEAHDIVASEDGTVHVGFFDGFGPITRSADGQWNPPVSMFRPLGWLFLIYVGLVAAAVAMATKVRHVGLITFVLAAMATVAMVGSWLTLMAGLEMLVVWALAGSAVVSGLVALAMALSRKSTFNLRRLAVAAVGLIVGLALAYSWKYVLSAPSWLYAVAPVSAVLGVAAGFLVPHATPPPPVGVVPDNAGKP